MEEDGRLAQRLVGLSHVWIHRILGQFLHHHAADLSGQAASACTPDQVTWLSALPMAAGSVACILGGAASDWAIRRFDSRKWGRRYVGLLGLGLAGPTLLAVNYAQSVWLLAVLLTAAFFFNDLTMGPSWAACADIGERYAGTLSGLMNTISSVAGACGAAMVGYLFKANRPDLVFVIFAGVYVLAALCWLGVDVTRRLSDVPREINLETGGAV